MKYTVKIDGEWLDDVLFKIYGSLEGVLETSFKMNETLFFNGKYTSLSKIGYRLPKGLELDLMDPPSQKPRKYLTLFD